jgi:hypothetical protein
MIDGHGDPNTSAAYRDALATVYPVAYGLKFLSKDRLDRDYVVMPLEALWWSTDMAELRLNGTASSRAALPARPSPGPGFPRRLSPARAP